MTVTAENTLHIIHCDKYGSDIEIATTKNRKQNLLEQCNQQSIPFVIIQGITKNLSICHNINLSHKQIVRMAMENGFERVIIAEDDLRFTAPGAWGYFLSQIPENYDLFFGVIYAGTIEDGRVMSAFSGGMTLYSVHKKFYTDFLSIPDAVHIDRYLGDYFSCSRDFFVCPKMVCKQMGGYSFNQARVCTYELYEQKIDFFKG